MADYQRILSYLYGYHKTRKQDCKGFIKMEIKRNWLKVTVSVEDDRWQPGITLSVLLYQEQSDTTALKKLGDLTMTEAGEEMILHLPDIRTMEIELTKWDGVILCYQNEIFYGSVWRGDALPVHKMNVPKLAESSPKPQEAVGPSKSTTKSAEPETLVEPAEAETVSKPTHTPEPEICDPEKTPGKVQELLKEAESDRDLAVLKEDPAEAEKSCEEPEFKQEPLQAKEKIQEESLFHPELAEGRKIRIDQIRDACGENTGLETNAFLRRGYEKHQYLVTGKVLYQGQLKKCVGVPGMYENRERYMARQYGFTHFLSLTHNHTKTGSMGYWLYIIEK